MKILGIFWQKLPCQYSHLTLKTLKILQNPLMKQLKKLMLIQEIGIMKILKRQLHCSLNTSKNIEEKSKNYFSYSYNKRDSIELNVLLTEKDREIIQLYLKGELGIEQVKEKDTEIAQLKEENSKLKNKNEELERLLAEKEAIEKEKIELEEQLRKIVKTDPDSSEVEIIQEKIRIKDDEITAIGDTTIAIDYEIDISVSDQKEANREAKEIVKERLEKEGFIYKRHRWIFNY
jgi:hypothetical protein